MYAVGKIGSYISRGVYTVTGTLHPFGGAVDVIVVQQPDGSFKSSPWYVRFGKFQGVLKAKEKLVNICVNGVDADFHMYLDQNGEAYFLKEVEFEEDDSALTSASGDERGVIPLDNRRTLYSKSCNFDADKLYPVDQNVLSKEQMLTRSTSQQLPVVSGRNLLKENRNEGEIDDSMLRRTDSLERVECPVNLLEAKWSTNLDSDKYTKDTVPTFSDSKMLGSEAHNVTQIDVENSQQSFFDGTNNSINQERFSYSLQEDNQVLENFVQKTTLEVACLSTTENNTETSTVDEGNLERKCEVVSEIVDESMLLVAKDERNSEGVLSGISGSDFQVLYPMELEACSDKQFDEEDSHKRNAVLQGSSSICLKEDITNKVQTILYCESSKTLMVRKEDASNKQTQETPCVSGGECGEVYFHTGILAARTTPLSKDVVMEQFADNVGLTKEQVDVQERYSHQENPSPFCVSDNVALENSAASSNSCTEMERMSPLLGSVQVIESKSICIISNVGDSGSLVRDDKNINDESSTIKSEPSPESIGERVTAEELTLHSSNSVGEEQFLFSDIDESKISEIQKMELNFSLNVDRENRCSDAQGCIVVPNESVNKSNEPYSLPEMYARENPLINSETSIGNSRESSKPVDIPRNHTVTGSEVERLAESMPNVGPCAESFGVRDIFQLSHSLDSKSIKLDREEVQQLSSEVPDIKDASVPTELEIVPAKVDLGNSSEKLLPPAGSWSLWPFRFGKSTSDEAVPRASENSNTDKASTSKICTDQIKTSDPSADGASESGTGTNGNNTSNSFLDKESERKLDTDGNEDKLKPRVVKKLVRIVSPTSEQLASLKLKDGRNTVTFTYSTAMLGDQQVDARIYLWKWNTRIVISDVDGTITKSDVLGQFMPLVGVDWSQTGVTHLFSAIKENGYQLLFLSARAISQAYITRQFLFNLKQDGKALPDGPMVISPDGLFPSLFREVIRRAPHEFKIACLEEIRLLFPPDCSPFYAGFGNRDTDEFSYLKVGIPKGKIFIINPKGEVAVNRRHDTRSYTSLHALVHSMFPSTPVAEQEDFNSWNFWKITPLDINF